MGRGGGGGGRGGGGGGGRSVQNIGGNSVSFGNGSIEINGRTADYSMLNRSSIDPDSRASFESTVISALQNNNGRTALREAARSADRRADDAERSTQNIRNLTFRQQAERRARAEPIINSNRALSTALNNVAEIMPRANRPGS